MCVKYLHRGDTIYNVPSDIDEQIFALYRIFAGFTPSAQPKTYSEINPNCRQFLEFGEDFLGRDLLAVSFSPERDGVILKE